MLGAAPPPFLNLRVLSLTFIHGVVLVEGRKFYEERDVACSLAPIFFADLEDVRSVRDGVATQKRFDELRSSSRQNSAFSHVSKLVRRVLNLLEAFSPARTVIFY